MINGSARSSNTTATHIIVNLLSACALWPGNGMEPFPSPDDVLDSMTCMASSTIYSHWNSRSKSVEPSCQSSFLCGGGGGSAQDELA